MFPFPPDPLTDHPSLINLAVASEPERSKRMGHTADSSLNGRLIGASRQPGGEWFLCRGWIEEQHAVTEGGGNYEILQATGTKMVELRMKPMIRSEHEIGIDVNHLLDIFNKLSL